MFKITNNLHVNLRARGSELETALKSLGLDYSLDKVNDRGAYIADESKLGERLRNGTCFSWIGTVNHSDTYFNDGDLDDIASKETFEDVARVYESRNIGFFRLEPQKSTEIEHNERFLDELINSSFAASITIEDMITGDVVWEGVEEEYTYELAKTYKDYDEGKKKSYKGKRIINKLHPQKHRAAFYKPVK